MYKPWVPHKHQFKNIKLISRQVAPVNSRFNFSKEKLLKMEKLSKISTCFSYLQPTETFCYHPFVRLCDLMHQIHWVKNSLIFILIWYQYSTGVRSDGARGSDVTKCKRLWLEFSAKIWLFSPKESRFDCNKQWLNTVEPFSVALLRNHYIHNVTFNI